MPIKGLTDRGAQFPCIGKIRKGAPKPETGNKPGADLKYLRFDGNDQQVNADFEKAYGREPKSIRVYLPYRTVEENFQTWMEEWKASSLVRRCDGCNIILALNGKTYSHAQSACMKPKCGCKQVGRLMVIIHELKRLAYVTVLTSSVHDIINIHGALTAFQSLRNDLTGIPFILSRQPRMISTPDGDGRARREKWLLHLEVDPAWSALQLTAMQQAALPQLNSGEIVTDEPEDDDDDVIESPRLPPPPATASQQTLDMPTPAQSAPVQDMGGDLLKSARARWAKAATAAQKAKRADAIIKIDGMTDPAAIDEAAATMEAALAA